MALKKAVLVVKMEPIAKTLPSSKAASIGRTIFRHAYLDWSLSQTVHNLMGASIKHGRTIYRRPPSSVYIPALQTLLELNRVSISHNLKDLGAKIYAADVARNALAHSVYTRNPNTGELKIQLVRGKWDLPPNHEVVRREINPEGQVLNQAFLSKQRRTIEAAVKSAEGLRAKVGVELRALNEKRRTQSAQDRRRP